jgi:vacuolar protein sorting-associated protein 45
MKEIVDLMDQGVDNGELLRLFLLYSLRYENDEKVKQLKEQLRPKVGGALEVATSLILYAGKAKRRGELFRTGFLAKPSQFLNSVFGEDIKNVFMQHKSKLAEIITDFSKGQLDKLAYPCFQGR